MPKPLHRLTNCYVPVLLEIEEEDENLETTTSATSVRPIHIHALTTAASTTNNSSSTTTHSFVVECGETQILCELQAPLPPHKVPSEALPLPLDEGLLLVAVQYNATALNPQVLLRESPTSLDTQHASLPQQQQRVLNQHKEHLQTTLAQTLQSALQAAIPLAQNHVMSLQFTILVDDGGVLGACTAAASLALAQAGIPMLDVVTAVQVAILPDDTDHRDATAMNETEDHDDSSIFSLWLDPSTNELSKSVGYVEWAYMPNRKWVTVWQQHSSARNSIPPASVTTRALALAKHACTQVWLPQLRTYMMKDMNGENNEDQ